MSERQISTEPPLKTRILLVDDHEMVREGLRSFLESEDDLEVVGEAADGAAAVIEYANLRPDIVVMDLRLPVKSGIEATREIVALEPNARVIVVTTAEGDGHIQSALEAGAWAYLLKDALRKEVVSAIRTVRAGKRVLAPSVASTLASSINLNRLTPREKDVLVLIAKGLRNREIGAALGTTENTVKLQTKSIFAKLDVTDRTEAATVALQRGLIDQP